MADQHAIDRVLHQGQRRDDEEGPREAPVGRDAGARRRQRPHTAGGLSAYKNLDLDETGVNLKASAGQVFGWYLFNAAAAARFVKFYDQAAAPTVGTDTPLFTLGLPAGAAANVEFVHGIAFANGIGLGATTGVADANTGAPAANDLSVAVFYK